jgi:PAS domain S-box-containing protein
MIEDIIKRKQAEAAQQISEERFRALVEDSRVGIIMLNEAYRITYINDALCRIFGYAREELLSDDFRGFLDEESKYVIAEHNLRRQKGEDITSRYEVSIIRKDGEKRLVEINSTVIKNSREKGETVGQVIDVTERKQAEEQLRAQALIFENIHDGIIMTDLKGDIINWNPAAERMFGYYKYEVFRKTIGVLATKIIKGSLRSGRWTGEMDFIRKDGTDGVCEIIVIPLRDEDGNITAVFGVCRDITERKQSEEKLRRSYDQLRETLIATVNTLASTIEMRDPHTAGHQRRVTLLSCAIAEEIGLTEDQFDGLRMAGLIHDLGKINIPAEILSKPGRINEIESSIIRYHPQIGHDILKTIELPWPVAQIVLQHHERMDGSGYPQGLKDGEIMLEARILAVADVVEAMASHRPYRPAPGIKLALEEITKNRGTLYDPAVVDACIKLFIEKNFSFE